MANKVIFIPGDGIGPEVMIAAKRVIDASGAKIEWEVKQVGKSVFEKLKTPLPVAVIESIKENKVALKGPVTTPIGIEGFRSVNVSLRKVLDLYANVRAIKHFDGVPSKFKNVDIVVIRETTEDVYGGIEHKVGDDGAESIKITTRKGSERIARFAFEYARNNKRKKITVAHLATIMKYTDGLFLEATRNIAKDYNDIEFEEIIIDTLSMKLIQNPEQFDVLLMPNLYGDFISSMATALIGGIGIPASEFYGDDIAIFEPVHGSAPDLAGKQEANPTGAILSGVLMLKHIGELQAALKIENAVIKLLKSGVNVTKDLGGTLSTMEFAKLVIEEMDK